MTNEDKSHALETALRDGLDGDEEALFETLGRAVGGLAAADRPPGWFERVGRRWYAQKRERIAQLVCTDARVTAAVEGARTHKGRIELAAVIADILTVGLTGAPAATLACLVVREGVQTLCQGYGDDR